MDSWRERISRNSNLFKPLVTLFVVQSLKYFGRTLAMFPKKKEDDIA